MPSMAFVILYYAKVWERLVRFGKLRQRFGNAVLLLHLLSTAFLYEGDL